MKERQIYKITFKDTGEEKFYTSITLAYNDNPTRLSVTDKHIRNEFMRKGKPEFENEYVHVIRVPLYMTTR